MPQQTAQPFLIARPAPTDGQILARAYASLDLSEKLLQQGAPSSFLGDQHHEPIPLADEIELTPIILTDQHVRDSYLIQRSVEQGIVPPLCPRCEINMKWYRSKRAEQNPKVIEKLVFVLQLFSDRARCKLVSRLRGRCFDQP